MASALSRDGEAGMHPLLIVARDVAHDDVGPGSRSTRGRRRPRSDVLRLADHVDPVLGDQPSSTGSWSGAVSVFTTTNSWVLGPSFAIENSTSPAGDVAGSTAISKSFTVADTAVPSPAEALAPPVSSELLQLAPPARPWRTRRRACLTFDSSFPPTIRRWRNLRVGCAVQPDLVDRRAPVRPRTSAQQPSRRATAAGTGRTNARPRSPMASAGSRRALPA